MLLAGQLLLERDRGELAVGSRHPHGRDALDEPLAPSPVLDQVGDGDHLQAVLPAVRDQVADPGHRSVVLHHLADDTRRLQAREPREVDGRLRLARSLEHAAAARAQREDVSRLDERVGTVRRVDGDLDRPRAVVGRDARGDSLARLDRDRERGAERRLVVLGHHPQPELVAAVLGQAETDQAAPLLRHEVDGLRSRELRGDRQVALVLAVVRVDDDDELPLANVLDRLFDRRERALVLHGLELVAHRHMLAPPYQALDVLGEHVGLEVHGVARAERRERRLRERVRDQRDLEHVVAECRDGQGDAFDRDRALLDAIAKELLGRLDRQPHAVALGLERADPADAVDMALDVVSAERLARPERGLEIDGGARDEPAERRARERFRHRVE